MPTRLQWLHNDGYCGEVSLVAALLKYGQYYSQYDVRDISTGDQQQFYLVGDNDEVTSKKVNLNYIEWDYTIRDSTKYLAWVKKMTRAGYAVTITVFMNYYMFYGITDKTAGERDYDHIVSISRVDSNYDDDLYHNDDIVTFSDHGLWAPRTTGPPYLFSYTMRDFIGTREQANSQRSGAIYTLPASPVANFGIAHTGNVDLKGDLLPILVETNVNYESPEIGIKSNDRPAAMEVKLTVTVSGLEEGVNYVLYKYESEKTVPSSNFNANKAQAHASYPIIGSESKKYVLSETIMSSQKVIYRCVKATAN